MSISSSERGMPSGPVWLLINSASECNHLVFPTHAAIPSFRNKLALASHLLPYAFYTAQVHMVVTSHRMYFWGLSLLLGFRIWCHTYKAYDINSQSAFQGSNRVLELPYGDPGRTPSLQVSTRGSCSPSQRETLERQDREVFLEHDYKALERVESLWVGRVSKSKNLNSSLYTPSTATTNRLLQSLALECSMLSSEDQAKRWVSSPSTPRSPLLSHIQQSPNPVHRAS